MFPNDLALDRNRDGKLNIADAIAILNFEYKLKGPTKTYELNCSNNPFAGSGIIVGVPKNGDRIVTITIYDKKGKLLRTLIHEVLYPARHIFRWDGKDDAGVEQVSGMYPCKMTAGNIEIECQALHVRVIRD